ncbi:hypothetical protein EYB25_005998 [Talaromyces marneffei]|nr:hypothetical protein EYB25_005998 [Talaromyces marneffei]
MSAAATSSLLGDDVTIKEQQWRPLLGATSSFAVEDMDETLEKIVNGGGRIFQDKQTLGRGMYSIAKFIDTEGNIFALFSFHILDSD